jgi:hypothetical protein
VGGGGVRVEREGSLDDVDGVVVLGAQAAVAAGPHRRVDLHPPAGEARGELGGGRDWGGERSSCGLGRRRDSAAWPWTRMGKPRSQASWIFRFLFLYFCAATTGRKISYLSISFFQLYMLARPAWTRRGADVVCRALEEEDGRRGRSCTHVLFPLRAQQPDAEGPGVSSTWWTRLTEALLSASTTKMCTLGGNGEPRIWFILLQVAHGFCKRITHLLRTKSDLWSSYKVCVECMRASKVAFLLQYLHCIVMA